MLFFADAVCFIARIDKKKKKSVDTKGDVQKIYGFVHPQHLC